MKTTMKAGKRQSEELDPDRQGQGLLPLLPLLLTEEGLHGPVLDTSGYREGEVSAVNEVRTRASNWIKTNKDENWFVWFRLYAPTEKYFDRSWPMNDIKKVK